MRSLYAKFIFLGILFICISLGLQLMWWKKGYNIFVYKLNDIDTGYFDRPVTVEATLTRNSSSPDGGIPKPTKRVLRKFSIWDTDSGQDRIPEQMRHVPENIQKGDNRTRIIIVDSGPTSWGVKEGSATFTEHGCPVRSCKLVSKNTDEKHIDAVLFGQDVGWFEPYEKSRQPDAVWIFFALESPLVTGNFDNIQNAINWTATYRRDSTMVAPYERWYRFENATKVKRVRNYAKGKSKMAAMFVSNCGASNNRLQYAKDLQQFVEVDIYGFCGDKQCPRTEAQRCFGMLNKEYKFYLAFENANCRDYITEKFFVNGLGHDVIPIVMGAHPEDYEEASPPHSYIHVEDFQSPKHLAEYMKKLDQNDELYNEYFNWKGTGDFLNTKFWCRLCSLVSDNNKPRRIVKNLGKWWRSQNMCITGRWTDRKTT